VNKALAAAVAVLLLAPYLWLALSLEPTTNGQDFLENGWLPARLILLGDNPYQPDQATVHQLADRYTLATSDPIDQQQFNSGREYHAIYPYWALLAATPFSTLDFPLALRLWTLLNGLLLLLGGYLAFKAAGGYFAPVLAWQAQLPLLVLSGGLALYLLAGVAYFVYRPAIANLYIGQHSIIIFALLALVYHLSRPVGDGVAQPASWEVLSGIALALATFKPQLVGLVVLLALLVWLWGRRWRPVLGFVLTGLLLNLAPLLLAPTALADWLKVSFSGQQQATRMAPVATSWWGTSYNLTGGGWLLAVVFSLLTLALLARPWWVAINSGRLANAMPLTVIVGLLITPYTLVYDQVLLLLPFAWLWLATGATNPRVAIYLRVSLLLWLTFLSVLLGAFVEDRYGYRAVIQTASLLLLYGVVVYLRQPATKREPATPAST